MNKEPYDPEVTEIILSHLAGGSYDFIHYPWMKPLYRKLINKNVCIKCGAKIPPGKAGRKCKSCRT